MNTQEFCLILLLVILSVCVLGVITEKLLHPNLDTGDIVHQLKRDVKEIIMAFFTSDSTRFKPDQDYIDDFKGLLINYANPKFNIFVDTIYKTCDKVPFLGISFLPQKRLSAVECDDIANLISLKFGEYVEAWGVDWRSFLFYSYGQDFIRFYVYFLEFPSDAKGFWKKYKTMLKLNSKGSYTLIEDELLNQELSHVG